MGCINVAPHAKKLLPEGPGSGLIDATTVRLQVDAHLVVPGFL
jgi:hypothetical protein